MENCITDVEKFVTQSIADEQTTIAQYINRREVFQKYLEQCTEPELKEKLNILIYTLNDIINEEKVHVGQFSEMLSLFNISDEKEIEGNEEAEEDISKLSFLDISKRLQKYVDGGIE